MGEDPFAMLSPGSEYSRQEEDDNDILQDAAVGGGDDLPDDEVESDEELTRKDFIRIAKKEFKSLDKSTNVS